MRERFEAWQEWLLAARPLGWQLLVGVVLGFRELTAGFELGCWKAAEMIEEQQAEEERLWRRVEEVGAELVMNTVEVDLLEEAVQRLLNGAEGA